MRAGELRHRVTLQNPTDVQDGEGGFTQTWSTFASRIPAQVLPATVRNLERVVASSVQAHASHLVKIRYRPHVSTKTRVIWHDLGSDCTLSATGVSDTHAAHIGLVLTCDEVVA